MAGASPAMCVSRFDYGFAAGQLICTWRAFLSAVKVQDTPLMVAVPLQPASSVPLTEQSTGVLTVVPSMVASIATPLLSVFTLTGSCTPSSCVQFNPLGPKLKTKRCARKVKRLLAAAGTGEEPALVKLASSCKRGGAMAS